MVSYILSSSTIWFDNQKHRWVNEFSIETCTQAVDNTTYGVYSFYGPKWFHNKRILAKRTATPLIGRMSSILQKNSDVYQFVIVEPVDNFVYHVKGEIKNRVVNLTNNTCTCRKFNLDLIPCSHACAAIRYIYNCFLYLCILYYIIVNCY